MKYERTMFNDLRQDFHRCGDTPRQQWREMLLNIGMWAVVSYRIRRWIFELRLPRLLRLPLGVISVLIQVLTQIVTNIEIPSSADIGPGLYIPHIGYIVVSSSAVLGRNCTITQGVTIGHGGGGNRTRQGSPIIGDRVYIGPGSALIGPIVVGDDVLIGPGAIVTRSIPMRGVAVGNPARLLSCKGSFDLISYRGMDEDPTRTASLKLAAEQKTAQVMNS